jgi:hypothetical protein
VGIYKRSGLAEQVPFIKPAQSHKTQNSTNLQQQNTRPSILLIIIMNKIVSYFRIRRTQWQEVGVKPQHCLKKKSGSRAVGPTLEQTQHRGRRHPDRRVMRPMSLSNCEAPTPLRSCVNIRVYE